MARTRSATCAKKASRSLAAFSGVYVEHRRETLEEDRLLRPDQHEIGLAARHVVLLEQMKPTAGARKVADFSDEVMLKMKARVGSDHHCNRMLDEMPEGGEKLRADCTVEDAVIA